VFVMGTLLEWRGARLSISVGQYQFGRGKSRMTESASSEGYGMRRIAAALSILLGVSVGALAAEDGQWVRIDGTNSAGLANQGALLISASVTATGDLQLAIVTFWNHQSLLIRCLDIVTVSKTTFAGCTRAVPETGAP
jgi:hypothetical protein